MKISFKNIFLLFFLNLIVVISCSCQSDSQKSPGVFEKKPKFDTVLNQFAKPIGYVNDYEKLYTSEQVYKMDSLMYEFEHKNSIQIVLVTFNSTMVKASEIEAATTAIGNGWKVGGDSSKGIVVGISKTYKFMRIENGKTIQRMLSDNKTKEIIDTVFIPEFKNDRYFEGTFAGIQALMIALENALTVKF